jgi:hypothetical protein
VGLFTYQDGSSYDGFWCGGRKHGIGVLRRPAAPSTLLPTTLAAAAAGAGAGSGDPSQQLPSSAAAGAAAATAAAEAVAASYHNGVEAPPATLGRLNSLLRKQSSVDPDRDLHALWGSSLPPDVQDSPRGPVNGVASCFAAAAGCNQGQGQQVPPPAQGACLGGLTAAGEYRQEEVDAAQPQGSSGGVAYGQNCLAGVPGCRQEQQGYFDPPLTGAAVPAAPGMLTWRSFSAIPAREGPKEPEGSEAAAAGVAGGRRQETVIIQVRRTGSSCCCIDGMALYAAHQVGSQDRG